MSSHTRFSTLARAVAEGADPSELLVELQRAAVTSLQASASLVLQRRGPSEGYEVTSSVGVNVPAGYRLQQAAARRLQALNDDGTTICETKESGSLGERLGSTERALLVPLTGSASPAFLVVIGPSIEAADAVATLEHRFACSSDWRSNLPLGREASLHREIQELLLRFCARHLIDAQRRRRAGLPLSETNALFGTERSLVWLHDRRNRELDLLGGVDRRWDGGNARTLSESDTYAARGLRLGHPQIVESHSRRVLVAPLRGWRRALGTLVVEGDPADLDEQQFL